MCIRMRDLYHPRVSENNSEEDGIDSYLSYLRLTRVRRMCGQIFERSVACIKHLENILQVPGSDVIGDDSDIYPDRMCLSCNSNLNREWNREVRSRDKSRGFKDMALDSPKVQNFEPEIRTLDTIRTFLPRRWAFQKLGQRK